MRRDKNRSRSGLTLMEVMVAIAIVAILTGIAYPSFRKMRASLRLNAAARALYGDIQLARIKAMEKSVSYTIIFGQQVSGVTYDYVIIEDKNNNGICDSPDCGTTGDDVIIKKVLISSEFPHISISPNISYLRFNMRGFVSSNGSITLTNQYGKSAKVTISALGRIKLEI